jgi:hypothetical protein
MKKEPTPIKLVADTNKHYYLDFDSEDENEVERDSGPYGKRQRPPGPVVYSFDTDNKG